MVSLTAKENYKRTAPASQKSKIYNIKVDQKGGIKNKLLEIIINASLLWSQNMEKEIVQKSLN